MRSSDFDNSLKGAVGKNQVCCRASLGMSCPIISRNNFLELKNGQALKLQ